MNTTPTNTKLDALRASIAAAKARMAGTSPTEAGQSKTTVVFTEPTSASTPALPYEPIDLELDDELKRFLLLLASSPSIENLRLIGPAGCGKTSIGQWLAQETKRDMLIMDCSVIREPRDWFGHRTIVDGKVVWRDTKFVEKVEAGNAVIILDELNRAPTPVLNGLMGLLDHRRSTWIEERGNPVIVGPRTLFLATTNVGARYLGASPIDYALKDRFTRVIEVKYLNEADETSLLLRRIPALTKEQAVNLCEISAKTRDKNLGYEPISTREILAAARDLSVFGEASLRYTLLTKIDDQSRRAALASLLAGKFPTLLGDVPTDNASSANI